jgi:glycosyltransferase involved in cell wall biosynthesis
MQIIYINRRFLDYRVPVLQALNDLTGGHLRVIYSRSAILPRVDQKIKKALGKGAIGLDGEIHAGGMDTQRMANQGISFHFHPGAYKHIIKRCPDIVVAEGFFKWSTTAVAARITHRIPLVFCYERTAHTERNAQAYRTLYRRLAVRLADGVCCNGSLCAEYVQRLGVPERLITTGHMAADTAGLKMQLKRPNAGANTKKNVGMEESDLLLLYVGQLIPRKGLKEFLEGWAIFEKSSAERCRLVIIGDGAQRKELEGLIQDTRLNRVSIIGPVDYGRIGRWYAAADVLVMPTLEDNWSLVVPEAMACGLPIVCSKYNGCWPELVHPGRNGWIFDPLEPADVLHTLTSVIGSRARLKEMGRESASIVADFSPRKAATAIFNACEKALRS